MPLDPQKVGGIFIEFLTHNKPYFDHNGELKNLVEELAKNNQKQTAIEAADKLRKLDGMLEIYARLLNSS